MLTNYKRVRKKKKHIDTHYNTLTIECIKINFKDKLLEQKFSIKKKILVK
jgi:hypothetical protein